MQAPFLESWIYDYGLLDELAVNAYWVEKYDDSASANILVYQTGSFMACAMSQQRHSISFVTRSEFGWRPFAALRSIEFGNRPKNWVRFGKTLSPLCLLLS
jgi:hypothetical protein